LIKIIAVIQIFNLAMGYSMWLVYGSLVEGWIIPALAVGSTALILALEKAVEHIASADLR
jgi:hypothetical protein